MGKKPEQPYTNDGVTLRRQSDSKKRVWWIAEWDDAVTGKRRRARLVAGERPEAEARKELDALVERRRALIKQQAAYTIGELWDMWLADRKKDGLSNDIYEFQWVAMKPHFESRTAILLTTDDCRSYAQSRFDKGRRPATVHTELSRLRACIRWSFEHDLIGKLPKVWVPSGGKPRNRVLSPDEAWTLIRAARDYGDPHIYVFIVLLFATGARHTAVLELEWDRVNFDAGTIKFSDDEELYDPMSKSWRKGRGYVVMSKMAREALEEIRPGRGKSGHVIEHGGRRLKTCREGFAWACVRAGLGETIASPCKSNPDKVRPSSKVTPHTVRHTVATWLRGKVQTMFTANLLGHEDEETTKKIYEHADAESTRPAVEVIDATFDALPELPSKSLLRKAQRPRKRKLTSTIDRNEAQGE
ncbi:site-specific integrase [Hyphomicrobium sp. MC1]|uniref:tyrosine-type recombinase/integrase n=1 Tax=Hyphomicrobium sp. (strain MC1) TaxID=717785 RepID=UPI000213DA7F|nr:site-specific integrase [Hyphomicrobium sp. MC1]CCB64420.1 putative Phage integrase [Hyphomicrobium sp. MC1]